MPMDKSLYPEDWDAIALAVKEAADWICQQCGRPCRRASESLDDFALRIRSSTWEADLLETAINDEDSEPIRRAQRFCLTVAHLDQNPSNNDRSNLKALCTGCHLNHDRPFQKMNGMAKQERRGQLNLFVEVRDASA